MDDVNKIIEESKPKPYGIIYYVLNTLNGMCYVGQTTRTVDVRWWEHVYDSRPGKAKRYFNYAIHKYGPRNFEIRVLLTVYNQEDLNAAEVYYIAFFNSTDPDIGYNGTLGGGCEIPSEATRKKISEATTGKRLGVPRLDLRGKKRSKESKSRMSEARKMFFVKKDKQDLPITNLIKEDYLRGFSVEDLSKKHNITVSAVRRRLKDIPDKQKGELNHQYRHDLGNESIVSMYNSGISLSKISKACGVTVGTIAKRLRESGIPVNSKPGKLTHLPEKDICEKYLKKESLNSLSKEYSISTSALERILQDNCVELRSFKSNTGTNNGNFREDIDTQKLVSDYLSGISTHALAKKHNTGKTTIITRLKKAGVVLRTSKEAQDIRKL